LLGASDPELMAALAADMRADFVSSGVVRFAVAYPADLVTKIKPIDPDVELPPTIPMTHQDRALRQSHRAASLSEYADGRRQMFETPAGAPPATRRQRGYHLLAHALIAASLGLMAANDSGSAA
jgi:hypothetical protein